MTGKQYQGDCGAEHYCQKGDGAIMKLKGLVFLGVFLLFTGNGPGTAVAQGSDPYQAARERMVEQQLKNRDITDPRVLAAMAKVPRHLFVPKRFEPYAYGDHPVPIGYDQTVSQPYIVGLMSQWAGLTPKDKVLEVGTGSGYQAAVLAELTDRVYTIELLPELAQSAAARLKELGYHKVQVKAGDGYQGWPEAAPFDAILVTAAAPQLPQALVAQLKEGGRLIIPLGPAKGDQNMILYRKTQGKLKEEKTIPVRFVPLVKP
jgi:protein-L-isoaspartate(D-aspartate) O-methyltransferase